MCICSTIGKHTLACNRHEIKCFLLQECTDKKCLWVCLLHSLVISLVSGYHHHPSMMHLSTHQDISFGQKIVHVRHLQKHLMEQVVYKHLMEFTKTFDAIYKNIWWSRQESNDQKCLWLCLLHSRGGARGSLPRKNFAWPPKIFRVTSWHCIEVLHRPLTAPLVAKLAPPVAPPNENVWLRPAAQFSDFTCLWMSSSSFNDAFIHTPRYFTWSKNCTRTPFRKTFDGAGCL